MTWIEVNVNGMPRSRMKTLSDIVPAAMELFGVGVLTLGRCMQSKTTCKHCIKRVNGFLGNASVEVEALAEGIFQAFAPEAGGALALAACNCSACTKLGTSKVEVCEVGSS